MPIYYTIGYAGFEIENIEADNEDEAIDIAKENMLAEIKNARYSDFDVYENEEYSEDTESE